MVISRLIHHYVYSNLIILLLFFSSFSGLGGLGPEYLLHAAGPASTLASSEFPFSIDGNNKYSITYILSLMSTLMCICVTELCVPCLAIGVVALPAGRRSTG